VFTLESRDGPVGGDAVAVAPDTEHAFEARALSPTCLSIPKGGQARAAAQIFSSASMSRFPQRDWRRSARGCCPTSMIPRRSDQSLLELAARWSRTSLPGSERDERPEARVRRMLAVGAGAPRYARDAGRTPRRTWGSPAGARATCSSRRRGCRFALTALAASDARARTLLGQGASLTEAAHGAGFSDSPHLSRTFRRMFGIAADSLRV